MEKYRLNRDEWKLWRQNEDGYREKLKASIYEQAGKVKTKILSPSMRIIGHARGEGDRPMSGAPLGVAAGTTVPSPDACVCKSYAGTPPGEHHAVCQFRLQWMQAQGIKTQIVESPLAKPTHVSAGAAPPMNTNVVQHLSLPETQSGIPKALPAPSPERASGFITRQKLAPELSRNVVATVAGKPLPSPTTCVCKDFPWPSGKRDESSHHPVCEFYEEWRRAHPAKDVASSKPMFLLDLETNVVMREASLEEIAEAEAEEKKSGSPIVRIDEKSYGLVPEATQP